MSVQLISNYEQKCQADWQTKNMDELKQQYQQMMIKVEKRKETCRKSSKQYYDKKFRLKENATAEQIKDNKTILEKRDKYQASYYEKNKENIKKKQKEYRMKRKAEKLAQKEKEKNYPPTAGMCEELPPDAVM